MIRFRAFDTDFTIPLPALLTPFLASRLGLRGSVGYVILSLWVHETAHLLAARLLRVRIAEIRLSPFGGSAKIENPYLVPQLKLIPVAAAGPAANLLLMILSAAAAQWKWISAYAAYVLFRINLLMMLFNLVPALPLDGGRILYGCLSGRFGEDRALNAGLWINRMLSAALILLALWGGIRRGKWNLTLLLAAVFLLASEHDEQDAHFHSRAARLSQALAAPVKARPARIYSVCGDMRACQALSLLRPGETAWFVLADSKRNPGIVGADAVLRHLMNGGSPEARLSEFAERERLASAL